jgi:calcineurin-like phosphoesterase
MVTRAIFNAIVVTNWMLQPHDITISIEGKGKVMVQRKNDNHTFVTYVLYVPSMKQNLLSPSQLLEKGFTMSMKHNCIQVFDTQNRLILKAPLSKNRTFKVNLQASEIRCFSSLRTAYGTINMNI